MAVSYSLGTYSNQEKSLIEQYLTATHYSDEVALKRLFSASVQAEWTTNKNPSEQISGRDQVIAKIAAVYKIVTGSESFTTTFLNNTVTHDQKLITEEAPIRIISTFTFTFSDDDDHQIKSVTCKEIIDFIGSPPSCK
ncbi:MAG: hypothetical protein S4CHLAM37_04270 [Chlamydiia bacterium]|nr:hypothetical protein [Chlamydiia bacterium]